MIRAIQRISARPTGSRSVCISAIQTVRKEINFEDFKFSALKYAIRNVSPINLPAAANT